MTAQTERAASAESPESIKAVPVRHTGRWVASAVMLVLVAMLVHTLATNPRFEWPVVGRYLFSAPIMSGLRNTLILTALVMVIALVIGIPLAVMRLPANPVLSSVAAVYIWFFLEVPPITQLIFWNFLAALFPTLGLGIPLGPEFVTFDTNTLVVKFTACLLGLGLYEAAYMAEIVRGGINSVDAGQHEAAAAFGMSR